MPIMNLPIFWEFIHHWRTLGRAISSLPEKFGNKKQWSWYETNPNKPYYKGNPFKITIYICTVWFPPKNRWYRWYSKGCRWMYRIVGMVVDKCLRMIFGSVDLSWILSVAWTLVRPFHFNSHEKHFNKYGRDLSLTYLEYARHLQ